MKNALFRRPSGLLTIVFLVGALLSAACGSVGVAVCGDWWCVGTPIPPPCYYCRSLSSAGADLNGDGIQDAIYAGDDDGMIKVRLGDGNGGVAAEQVFPRGLSPVTMLRTGDFDGDTNNDVVLIDTAGARLQVILGSGVGGTPTQGPIVPVPGIGRIVDAEVGRADGGPMDDIILLDDASGVTVMLGGVAGTLNPAPAGRTVLASGGTAFDAGLIDGDALSDIFVVDSVRGSARAYGATGTGGFLPLSGPLPVSGFPFEAVLAELDGQAGLDAALLLGNGSTVEAWFGNGAGGFTRSPQGGVGTNARAHRVLAVPSPSAPAGPAALAFLDRTTSIGAVTVLPNRGDGTFVTPPQLVTFPHAASTAILTDLEQDGRADLIVLSTSGITILTGGPDQD